MLNNMCPSYLWSPGTGIDKCFHSLCYPTELAPNMLRTTTAWSDCATLVYIIVIIIIIIVIVIIIVIIMEKHVECAAYAAIMHLYSIFNFRLLLFIRFYTF